nr:zinc-binding dehydrogenase [uncultured Faecalicatena sp.]
MKALIYYGPKDIRMEERPMPECGEHDVIVKVARAGICGSDLKAYLYDGMSVGILYNGQFGHDGQFGHEMVGTVYQVGSKCKEIKAQDRVFINPTSCKRNGMMGCDIADAFSEYVLVEEAAYGYNLLKLADDISFDEAVVIEPLAVGTHGKNCIHVKPHENVVIYGAGTIGLCTLNAVLAIGCQKPVVVDMNRERLLLAKKMGAVIYHPEEQEDLEDFLKKQFGVAVNPFGFEKPDVDAFIDCAGAGNVLGQIINVAKETARIAVVAIYKHPIELDAAAVLAGRLTLQGSCGYEMPDIIEAFHNINSGRTQTPEIVTNHFKHTDFIEAFEMAADPLSGAIKVVIDYEE